MYYSLLQEPSFTLVIMNDDAGRNRRMNRSQYR